MQTLNTKHCVSHGLKKKKACVFHDPAMLDGRVITTTMHSEIISLAENVKVYRKKQYGQVGHYTYSERVSGLE